MQRFEPNPDELPTLKNAMTRLQNGWNLRIEDHATLAANQHAIPCLRTSDQPVSLFSRWQQRREQDAAGTIEKALAENPTGEILTAETAQYLAGLLADGVLTQRDLYLTGGESLADTVIPV